MGWKEELFRTESCRSKPLPAPARPYTNYTVSSVSSQWTDRSMSDVSSVDSESVYSRLRIAPPPRPSNYSMPMSSRPPQIAYANIVPTYPPDSPRTLRYDNGTGKLSPEVMNQIKQTGRPPRNFERTDSINAAIADSRASRASGPEVSQGPSHQRQVAHAPSHHSMTPSLAYAAACSYRSSNREKRYGTHDLPLAPAPLNLPRRKRSAGSGVAGTRPPVPPLPPSKDPPVPKHSEPIDKQFVAGPRSTPPSLPNGHAPKSYPLQMQVHLDTEPRTRSEADSRHGALCTRTATPTSQGRHISSAADRPYRPAKGPKDRKGKAKATDDPYEEDSAVSSASVAAGRAMWNSMRTEREQAGDSDSYRSTGRSSEYEREFLRRRSIREVSMKEVNKRKSVNKRRKEEERMLEKERVKQIGSKAAKVNLSEHKAQVSAAGKPSLEVKEVINNAKRAGRWWRKQSWRYGDGYWEKVKEDKKARGKKQREEEEVSHDVYGRPIETGGWYSDTDCCSKVGDSG